MLILNDHSFQVKKFYWPSIINNQIWAPDLYAEHMDANHARLSMAPLLRLCLILHMQDHNIFSKNILDSPDILVAHLFTAHTRLEMLLSDWRQQSCACS